MIKTIIVFIAGIIFSLSVANAYYQKPDIIFPKYECRGLNLGSVINVTCEPMEE